MPGRTDCVGANGSGNNERFGIMDKEWLESAVRTLHDGFRTLDEIENVDSAAGVMWHGLGEPMPARLDKLALVRAGPLQDAGGLAGDT